MSFLFGSYNGIEKGDFDDVEHEMRIVRCATWEMGDGRRGEGGIMGAIGLGGETRKNMKCADLQSYC